MILEERIRAVLESAILAPSAENLQPWELVVKGNTILVYDLPDANISVLNFRQRGSLVVHGALIENALIASSALGYKAKLTTFPDPGNRDLIARIDLEESEPKEEPLYPYIRERVTNRKPYRRTPLTDEQRVKLTQLPQEMKAGKVSLIEGYGKMRVAAEALACFDRLIFENRHIHRFVFENLRWTREEANPPREGLDVRTLEVSRFELGLLRLARHWWLLRILNSSGFCASRAVSKASETYLSSAAFGALAIPGDERETCVLGGRILERIWLEATRMGLSFHPIAGLAVPARIISSGKSAWISPRHVKMILQAYERLTGLVHFDEETLLVCFRVGYADPPSARSLRYPLEKVVKVIPSNG